MDKMFIRFFVLVFVVAASVQGLNAQTGYMCDFESEAENSQWTMNQGLLGNNRWHIGAAVHNGGQKSMYVTADEGATAGYEAKSTLLVSYRTLTLPKDTFEIAFDWQAFGFDDNDALYVCWVDTTVITKSNTLSIVPNWVKENAIYFNDSIKLYSSTWQTAFDTIVSDGTARKLAFVWINGDRAAVSPAACIDNINIIPLSACQKPSNIEYTATDTSVMVTWDGLADLYDIRCTSTANPGEWVEQSGITENRFEIKGFGEGVFTVYIRSNCDNMHTVWASYKRFVFYPGSRCVDYLELTDKNCFYGVASVPRDKQGVIDYGYLARASRHTVHYDKEETDIRTNGNLPTVPDGEVASVRLGNWFWDFEGEAVEYPFRVDAATSGILLMKYAVVLQDPGHDPANQPRFQLKIRDKDGNIVGGGGCADIDFVSGSNTDGWIEASPLGDGEDLPCTRCGLQSVSTFRTTTVIPCEYVSVRTTAAKAAITDMPILPSDAPGHSWRG